MAYYPDPYYDARPPMHRYRTDQRRSQGFLDPNFNSTGLYRTRSQGAQPAPNVYIYNDNVLDSNMSQRSSSRSPPTIIYPPSPRYRGRDDELAEGVLALALDNRARSRSRGRSDAGVWDGRGDYYERQFRDMERQRSIDRERERIKADLELQRIRDEEERKRIIADHDKRLREEEDERKAEEERIKAKIKKDEQDAKEKKEREYEAFLQEQEKKKREEKEKKEKEEEHLQEEMRKRLRRFGYTETQIEIMIKEESDKKAATTTSTTTTITRFGESRNPIYPKIHVKYLSIDTLRYYELPWEYDSFDSNYIIIKREMDKYETEVLFEHTRKLRAGGGKLLLLEPKKEKEFAFYRKRDRSRSRIRKVGILELK